MGLEGVLAHDCALGLIVELEMDPVDGEVPLAGLRRLDEGAAESGPRGLGRSFHCVGDLRVFHDTLGTPVLLEQVVETPGSVDIVIGEIHHRQPGIGHRESPGL